MQNYDEWFEENEEVFVDLPLLGTFTYNEWHAIILGAIGILDPKGAHFALAIGLVVSRGNARRTIRHEPWYFLVVLIVTSTIRKFT